MNGEYERDECFFYYFKLMCRFLLEDSNILVDHTVPFGPFVGVCLILLLLGW